MKILVFEYITGGGFNKQALPESLAEEGCLMLRALLENLCRIEGHEISVMLDSRFTDAVRDFGVQPVVVTPDDDMDEVFGRCLKQSDAVWPVAPEFDGILHVLCETVTACGKLLLTSPPAAVALTADKFATYERLIVHGVPAVPTKMLDKEFVPGNWVIKPIDGAGCGGSFVVESESMFERLAESNGRYIIQPHLDGTATSLSCLFKQGRAWLICVNLQNFQLLERQYHLVEIAVNYCTDLARYRQLADRIAQAVPELWGYAGIDLIECGGEIQVLEINPRLTSSFAGIYEATRINVAEEVLKLTENEPRFNPASNHPVTVRINREYHAD